MINNNSFVCYKINTPEGYKQICQGSSILYVNDNKNRIPLHIGSNTMSNCSYGLCNKNPVHAVSNTVSNNCANGLCNQNLKYNMTNNITNNTNKSYQNFKNLVPTKNEISNPKSKRDLTEEFLNDPINQASYIFAKQYFNNH